MANEVNKVDLNNLDCALAVDTSGTMRTTDAIKGSPLTRLEATRETAVAYAAELEAYDKDGITVVRFAGKVRLYDGVTSKKVEEIFQEFRAMGSTNTKEAVEQLINLFLGKRATAGAAAKPAFIMVFTDGKPDDPVGLAQVIVDATKRIKDRTELGILFVQVGEDPEAADYLAKLNNDLGTAGAKHDIVAVCKLIDLEDLSLQEVIEMAFND
jgi:uncharacterized protein YegL